MALPMNKYTADRIKVLNKASLRQQIKLVQDLVTILAVISSDLKRAGMKVCWLRSYVLCYYRHFGYFLGIKVAKLIVLVLTIQSCNEV